MNKKGFTLIELLSIVVILGITFMYILPKMVSMFKEGEKAETEIIEERVISAARDYVNYIDGSFYTKFYKEGDTNYIYKTDLINSKLIDEKEIELLDTFAGVKGELLKDDKMKYTVEYIDAEPREYTNEELYLMIQSMGGSGSGGASSEVIDDLQSQINSLKQKNSFLDAYPIGSIYISTSNKNPSTIGGGTWESFGTGRTLVGVDGNQEEFASVEKKGGSMQHQHKYGLQFGGFWYQVSLEKNLNAGLLDYSDSTNFTILNTEEFFTEYTYNVNSNAGESGKSAKLNHYRLIANTSASSTLQPYITVYMWKRTA